MLQNLPDFVGHALRDQRARSRPDRVQAPAARGGQGAIAVTSLAFVDHGPLPATYTADGDGSSPPLQWHGVPEGTHSIVVIVEDADSPTPHPLVHAILVGLAPEDGALAEGAMNDAKDTPADARLGRNSYLQHGWLPPDPPPGHGRHRYAFQVFALADGATLPDAPGRDALMDALAQSAIASGLLIGTYERHDTSVKNDEPADVLAAPDSLPQGAALG